MRRVSVMTQGRQSTWAERLLRRRRLARAPIWIYRTRLGVLFGTRLLLLEHVGRRSGQTRYVVVEAAARPAPGVYVVVSGFGTQAQWFQNVMADPRVRISVGWRYRRLARARRLEAVESRAVLERYAVEHPRAWRALKPIVEASAERDPNGPEPAVVEFQLL